MLSNLCYENPFVIRGGKEPNTKGLLITHTIFSVLPMNPFCRRVCLHIFFLRKHCWQYIKMLNTCWLLHSSLVMPGFQTPCCQCCRSNLSICLVLSPNVAELRGNASSSACRSSLVGSLSGLYIPELLLARILMRCGKT